jgi:hypothetical protein
LRDWASFTRRLMRRTLPFRGKLGRSGIGTSRPLPRVAATVRFPDHRAGGQPAKRELVFMPLNRPCRWDGASAQLGGYLPLPPGVSTVRYPIPQRTFKYVGTVESVTDETCQLRTFKRYARTGAPSRAPPAALVSPLGYAAAGCGRVSSSPRCATAALAASRSPATCTVGKANLMPFSSKVFLIIA